MKKMQTLAIALALVALGSVSWSATSLNSSRIMQKKPPDPQSISLNSSRSNIYRLITHKNEMSDSQAKAILAKLDQFKGAQVEEATVRKIVKDSGVQAVMEVILYLAKSRTRESPTYIMLQHPKDKEEAIALANKGAPSE
jgi:hypothetical protein